MRSVRPLPAGPPATPQYAYTTSGTGGNNVASTETGQDLLDGYLQARNQTQNNGNGMMTASGSAPVVGGDVGTEMGAMQMQGQYGGSQQMANMQQMQYGGSQQMMNMYQQQQVSSSFAVIHHLA